MSSTRKSSGGLWLIAVPPPILYAVAFLIGLGLGRVFPWLSDPWPRGIRLCGVILIAFGILLAPGSAGLFGMKRTTLNPLGRPSSLVVSGAFRFTRNPMYLGLAFGYVGLALLLNRVWPVALLPIPLMLMNRLVIPHEEARMREIFGSQYADYCGRVRRWI